MTLLAALTGDADVEALLSDSAQLQAMLRFEEALAASEAAAGMISEPAASAVRVAIEGFVPDWQELKSGMARDGVVVPALIKQLRQRVEPEHANALHMGATSQDVIDTALMLQLSEVLAVLDARLVNLLDKLGRMASADADLPLMAHTRMQAALPTTVGEKLRTWRKPLVRHLDAVSVCRRQLAVQLGGPVGDRLSFDGKGDEIARDLAGRLGLAAAAPWQSMRDPVVSFGSLLALISGSMGKLGADVTMLAQTEIGSVRLEGAGGSSSMPHKANPVSAEVLVSLARFNAGLMGTLHQAMVHENERSGAAWTLEWMVLPQMCIATGASLRLGNTLLEQLRFTERLERKEKE
ncbi:3-carboxy-cis,cis-muconate cycloisomerase [Devosia sp. RR2S18]|uniref:3-carboxy-cis,cis-muconate cycloisomerase n=1 Tax=Devosia rhizosphaerae TaxID=3049774 RepID=UPI00254203BC|nr:3-carboxy-cis,cis-muconate cycloisomerase [Devosia sp. RR2S18]WIJ25081.1 3-carboxy-cis,cis-muconate cycloisomerase [Devosia sp. RR2S18]